MKAIRVLEYGKPSVLTEIPEPSAAIPVGAPMPPEALTS